MLRKLRIISEPVEFFLDQIKDEEWIADRSDSEPEQEGCHENELVDQLI